MAEQVHGAVRVERPRCPYCHEDVNPDNAKAACSSCMAWHHDECWKSHGGCAACGALRNGQVSPVAAKSEAPSLARAQLPCSSPGCTRPVVLLGRELCREHALAWARRSLVIASSLVPLWLLGALLVGLFGNLGEPGWMVVSVLLVGAVVTALVAESARRNVRRWADPAILPEPHKSSK